MTHHHISNRGQSSKQTYFVCPLKHSVPQAGIESMVARGYIRPELPTRFPPGTSLIHHHIKTTPPTFNYTNNPNFPPKTTFPPQIITSQPKEITTKKMSGQTPTATIACEQTKETTVSPAGTTATTTTTVIEETTNSATTTATEPTAAAESASVPATVAAAVIEKQGEKETKVKEAKEAKKAEEAKEAKEAKEGSKEEKK
ncbi:hypothetical protein B0T13DRAFT_457169 [Neurospora crassa]|nr:hypothetical protein B0T13DRAFT_457169 [Neurospora crassa]